MTTAELRQQLAFLDQPGAIGIEVYLVLKVGPELQVRFADVEAGLRTELQAALLGYLGTRFRNNQDVTVEPLTQAQEREHTIYEYDLPETPAELACIDVALGPDPKPEFSFAADGLQHLAAFVFVIGNEEHKIALYKKHYPISLLRRDSFLGLVPADHRFVRVTTDVLKVNETFELLKVGDDLFVFSVALLERLYGFDGIVIREATQRLALLGAANIIDNLDVLAASITDIKLAKKLLRAKRSAQVLNLPFATIRDFIRQHPKLKNRIRFNAAGNRIHFHTKTSQELFLKLLDDDFLKSELTGMLYDSEAKQDLTPDEEPDGP